MIRANFGIDPAKLERDEWAMLFQQAVWLENKRLENFAKVLTKLLAPSKN